ncbi:beta-ketoacyl-ACP synthase 3 [Solwaraspora sp. WMMD791]|uniref:3-oxoacyl-ACP synthase III family protein n=1 Tax=Solwaraspora sp. WMMD791 TaxID=3016086 RepID=UPI002499F513|nr:beta-ketoacyl-ACP synthase 3 [Solwaraspora sp. WMMD791]WFE29018.1 beta-ketoacyl-ACP synthase 3 [Solwaraspora sp. WMMD791]
MRTPSVAILGTGSYLPKDEVDNDEVAARVGVDPGWIDTRTQIRTRRYAAPHEATSDLAASAAEQALRHAGTDPDEIDYLILSTSTPDAPLPSTACVVQDLIGARNAAAFDINIACSGFVYALALADALLARRPGTRALVVAADIYSRVLDFQDRRTAVLLGDGAGAAVLGVVGDGGLYGFKLVADGAARDLIWIDAGGSRRPASARTVADGSHYLRMHGRQVSEFVVDRVPATIAALLAEARLPAAQVDHFVPHQANGVLVAELSGRCGLTAATTHRTVERYGNIGSASVPVTLDVANRAGLLHDGQTVVLAGFGAGMSVGAALLRWTATR